MKNIFIKQFIVLVLSVFTLTLFSYGLALFFELDSGLNYESFTGSGDFTGTENFTDSENRAPENSPLENKQSTNVFLGYFDYLHNLISGNWGSSKLSNIPILESCLTHLPATLELSFTALIFALVFGLPLGVVSAQKKFQWQDKLISSLSTIIYAMPVFWWGILLVLFFSIFLGVTPVGSRIGFEYNVPLETGFILIDSFMTRETYGLNAFYSALHHLILPTLVLGTIPLAIFVKVMRSSMIDALNSSYVKAAKAKGLSGSKIVWGHALRNAMIPVITIIGLQVNTLITGTLITEIIFSWPGLGKWLLNAVTLRDYAAIHGGIFTIALVVILVNIVLETIAYYTNPKSRLN